MGGKKQLKLQTNMPNMVTLKTHPQAQTPPSPRYKKDRLHGANRGDSWVVEIGAITLHLHFLKFL